MNWRTFFTISALALSACAGGSDDSDDVADSDGDGISDAEEEKLGLDPDSSDSDGDGVDDAEELDQGLDPLLFDSDEDGYSDGDELHAGTDPLDVESVIYDGGWPYSTLKDELDPADVPSVAEEGELFMDFVARDQFGQEVHLWDYMNDEGKYIIVDVSAEWCGPCQVVALWLDGGPDYYGLEPEFGPIREAVDNGDAYWVTILAEDRNGAPANGMAASRWFQDFPHPNVPVLADSDSEAIPFVQLTSFPYLIVLKPDMTVSWKAGRIATWDRALSHTLDKLQN